MTAPELNQIIKFLKDFLKTPVAPFREDWIKETVTKNVSRLRSVTVIEDSAGNLYLRYRPKGTRRSRLCFQSHMDHPGFIFQKSIDGKTGMAKIHGGVSKELIGTTISFFSAADAKPVKAKVTTIKNDKMKRPVEATVSYRGTIEPGAIGMFDFAPLIKKGKLIEGRAFDATMGAGILTWLVIDSARKKIVSPFDVLLTRAEEAGLVGSMAVVRNDELPLQKNIVTVEFPRATDEMALGEGVVNRIGDSVCAYDPKMIAHIDEVALQCTKQNRKFKIQRRLGWTGRTEASLFSHYGFNTGCICLPNKNIHNCGDKGRIMPETVHADDLFSMICLMQELLHQPCMLERSWLERHKRMEKRGGKLVRRLYK